ncbi:WLM domain-containing protein [Linnemannia elongata]|nr:WLM domain-containing protein [Linnemannia elongata]
MSSNSSSLDLVSSFTCLTSKHNHEEAMRLLKKVATMVRPIMKAHGWKITTLAEFYTKGLLGMNTNRGWKIQLCLRYHNDENTFLPWEDILGTMLHELAHNIRGPHDQQFYKALDGLNDEYDKIVASGYTGEGFDTAGHRLGTKHGGFGPGGVRLGGAVGAGLVTSGTRAAAVVAAERRRQMNEMMLPVGGRKLGGSGGALPAGGGRVGATPKGFWEQWHSPGELAAMAAERRAKDQVWCGSSPSSASSPSSNQSSTSPSPKTPLIVTSSSTVGPSKGSSTPTSASCPPPERITIIIDGDDTPTVPTKSVMKRRGSNPSTTAITTATVLKKPRTEQDVSHMTTTQKPARSSTSTARTTSIAVPVINQWAEWACPLCTLVNRPLVLQCECCLTHRPAE